MEKSGEMHMKSVSFQNRDNFRLIKQIKSRCIFECVSVDQPYISIIIPTYKRAHLLPEALESALNQEDAGISYEIIVVDNESSPDHRTDTEILMQKYINKNVSYYINEENLGVFGNWNRAIELAKSNWVSMLHDDDLLRPCYLKRIAAILKKVEGKDFGAICAASRNWDSGAEKPSIKRNKNIKIMRTIDALFMVRPDYGAPCAGTIFDRKKVIAFGGFDSDYYPCADSLFFGGLGRQYRIYKTCECLGYHRLLENDSLTLETNITAFNYKESYRLHLSTIFRIAKLWNKMFDKELRYINYSDIINSSMVKPENREFFKEHCIVVDYSIVKARILFCIRYIFKVWKYVEAMFI
jgi:glycosyltransferase involved in cell wall biosynthesis